MTFCFRRLYSSRVPTAFTARTASTPLAVRLRRAKKAGRELEPGQTDATSDGLTPTEQARYTRSQLRGLLPKENMTPTEWGQWINSRRSRLRGFRTVKNEDGTVDTHVVGVPIFLPNIVLRMVRNNTPPGQSYNPYEATFRVPLSITKTDIRSYLHAVYGVKTTYIRTDVYYPAAPSNKQLAMYKRGGKLIFKHSYKRAVVGLVDPFYYPHRMEDMSSSARVDRETYLNDAFQLKELQLGRRLRQLRISKRISSRREKLLLQSLSSHRASPDETMKKLPVTGRANILKKVAEQRRQREELIHRKADEFAKHRLAVKKTEEKKVAPETVVPAPSLSQKVSGWMSRL